MLFINIKYGDVAAEVVPYVQRAVIHFCDQKDLMQMRLTLRYVQCMAMSVLRDQQNMIGVCSLLTTEKALLIRNDLASICCDNRCHDCHS